MAVAVSTGSVTQLWLQALGEAQRRAHRRLPENQESYLIFTLVRHCRDAILTDRTLALELLDGLSEEQATRRDDRLRDVGDRCLLVAGLFPDLGRRRCVGPGYYLGLGQAAYGQLGQDRRTALSALYIELAHAFVDLVRVLACVRCDGDAAVRTTGAIDCRVPEPVPATPWQVPAWSPPGSTRVN
jgi:hypothetical protein